MVTIGLYYKPEEEFLNKILYTKVAIVINYIALGYSRYYYVTY